MEIAGVCKGVGVEGVGVDGIGVEGVGKDWCHFTLLHCTLTHIGTVFTRACFYGDGLGNLYIAVMKSSMHAIIISNKSKPVIVGGVEDSI